MPLKGMTANPVRPARYRPGKPAAEDQSSEAEYETEEEDEQQSQPPQRTSAPPPKAASFPADAAKIAKNLRDVDLNERRRQADAEEAARLEAEKIVQAKEEEGFVTEESEEEESSEDSEGSESGSKESSSEDEAPRKLLRPTFIKRDKRKDSDAAPTGWTEDEEWAEFEAERKAKADALIQDQLNRHAAANAAGKKDWDDDEDLDVEEVDDTDEIDPEMERAAWKLRELKRVKRDREAIEQAEKEREEIERRRNLTKEEREAEDKKFLELQKEERDGKGKMGYMQKYFHKGAFFQDDAKAEGMDRRDIMGSRYQDDVVNRELLPQYMQIRDMTRLGRKGRTKYKDLKTEDTGRWGQYDDRGPRRYNTLDERFQPDKDGGGRGPSGANSTAVEIKKQVPTHQEVRKVLHGALTLDQDRLHQGEIDIKDLGGVLTRDQGLLRPGETHLGDAEEGHTQSPGHRRHDEIGTGIIGAGGNGVHPHTMTGMNRTKGRGLLQDSVPEASLSACSFRGAPGNTVLTNTP
ncbi:MAG: hypothetical protein LQ346_002985 [Caloplaca aetnensis]|nr:MAG: hypothetical protein LQ346_002985 [Caloplaca aetnensis]